MAENNLSGFDELSNLFNNLLDETNFQESEIIINIENIQNNLDEFNNKFKTNFNKESSKEDYQDYFSNEFIKFKTTYLENNIKCIENFNTTYSNFAHIEL